jgi:hypothetical protein
VQAVCGTLLTVSEQQFGALLSLFTASGMALVACKLLLEHVYLNLNTN